MPQKWICPSALVGPFCLEGKEVVYSIRCRPWGRSGIPNVPDPDGEEESGQAGVGVEELMLMSDVYGTDEGRARSMVMAVARRQLPSGLHHKQRDGERGSDSKGRRTESGSPVMLNANVAWTPMRARWTLLSKPSDPGR